MNGAVVLEYCGSKIGISFPNIKFALMGAPITVPADNIGPFNIASDEGSLPT